MKLGTKYLAVSMIAFLQAAAGPAAAQDQKPVCRQFMEQKQQQMKQMQQWDQELKDKVQEMNSATGQDKVDKMAAIITEMVRQREEMHKNMLQMREQAAALKGSCPGMMKGDMMRGGKQRKS